MVLSCAGRSRATRLAPVFRRRALAAAISTITASMVGSPALAESGSAVIEEVVVTATRRAQDITEIPYNITAVSAEQIARTRVSSLEDLALQIPNLTMNTTTNGSLAGQRPVMRGLNASRMNRGSAIAAGEETPVAVYLGNTLFGNYFPIDDIERVEVLRGPQGTLYGSGTLGGAIRLVPTEPQFEQLNGAVEASGGLVAHSDDYDRTVSALVNVPLGATVALRMSLRGDQEAGFVDQLGVMERRGGPTSAPVPANPSDLAGSPGVFETVEDMNENESESARISLRWAPNDQLDVVAAFNYSDFSGEYGPLANTAYDGGTNPIDGSTDYPALGDYEFISPARTPYDRQSRMGSLDASYDLGFATVSSTTSYLESDGESYLDSTFGVLQLPAPFIPYYAGDPLNPRFLAVSQFGDDSQVFTQEIRLVSNGEERLNYIVGAFYQREDREANWFIFGPGTAEQTAASPGGIDVPVDQTLDMRSDYALEDYSLFGELTYSLTDNLDVTGGVRHFVQDTERDIVSALPLFGIVEKGSNELDARETFFKLNVSYAFLENQTAYATFSQGFRRAGVNSWPTTGFTGENPDLLAYESDVVDNYEVGVKGYLGEYQYAADVFFVAWDKPQIGGTTPFLVWPAVLNAEEAESKGVELELSGPLFGSLEFSIGYSYADAQLSQDLCIDASVGNGVLVPCAISAEEGDRLPGAPEHSATGSLLYERSFGEYLVTASLNANYKGGISDQLPTPSQPTSLQTMPAYWLVNAYVGFDRGPWQVSVYALNLFDERPVLGFPQRAGSELLQGLERIDTIGRPRTAGVTLRYSWGDK